VSHFHAATVRDARQFQLPANEVFGLRVGGPPALEVALFG